MGRVEGKVAFITGAARGQGRSHAVRLAEEGADIIAIDICEQIDTVPASMGTEEDLAETVRVVEAIGRRIVARKADVRDFDRLKAAVDEGVQQLGRLDIVSANAGIGSEYVHADQLSETSWRNTIDVNLTGVWNTYRASLPHIRAGKRGGAIVITSSGAAYRNQPNLAPYVASRVGVLGLMRTLALEVAQDMIRVNAILPTTVNTAMIHDENIFRLFRPDLENPGIDDVIEPYKALNALPIPWVEPIDISNALLFLASDEGRYITGVALPVDAGCTIKPSGS